MGKVTYLDWKRETVRKHKGIDKTETSSMNQYGEYTKTYILGDGTIMIEENRPEWRDGVKWFTTEAYTSKNPVSVIFREKW